MDSQMSSTFILKDLFNSQITSFYPFLEVEICIYLDYIGLYHKSISMKNEKSSVLDLTLHPEVIN